jgi:hypothetical protein
MSFTCLGISCRVRREQTVCQPWFGRGCGSPSRRVSSRAGCGARNMSRASLNDRGRSRATLLGTLISEFSLWGTTDVVPSVGQRRRATRDEEGMPATGAAWTGGRDSYTTVGFADKHASVADSRAGNAGLQLPIDGRVGALARSDGTCPCSLSTPIWA